MKLIGTFLFFLGISVSCYAGTIGSPVDMSVPEATLHSREQAIDNAMDIYEYNMNIRTSVDVEAILERELNSAPADVSNARLEGQSVMFRMSNNFNDIIEPYIKIGTSEYKVQWDQLGKCVTVDSKLGFAWEGGVKAKLWEFTDFGVKLTLDAHYRQFDEKIDKKTIGGGTEETSPSRNELFEIKEWQLSLLASKKLIIPFGNNDLYIIPYAGITYTNLDVDVKFTWTSSYDALYSVYNASDRSEVGAVVGWDILPSLTSWYLLTFELRLINEIALTLGGTVRF